MYGNNLQESAHFYIEFPANGPIHNVRNFKNTQSTPIRTLKSNVRLIKHNIFGQDCYHVFHIIIILCGKILPAVKTTPTHSSFMVGFNIPVSWLLRLTMRKVFLLLSAAAAASSRRSQSDAAQIFLRFVSTFISLQFDRK